MSGQRAVVLVAGGKGLRARTLRVGTSPAEAGTPPPVQEVQLAQVRLAPAVRGASLREVTRQRSAALVQAAVGAAIMEVVEGARALATMVLVVAARGLRRWKQ